MWLSVLALAAVLSKALVANSLTFPSGVPLPEKIEIPLPFEDRLSKVLSVDRLRPRLTEDPGNLTAVVTHAGKNQQEYIDMAIMLGLALRRYAPHYPRVAMVIKGMKLEYKILLRKAGWRVLTVDDIDACNSPGACDKHFNFRWKDSFEKLNAFRLPFRRVLYLDADTYIFSRRIRHLLNSTMLDEASTGQIGMPLDTCGKTAKSGGPEFNSGVMLFKPDVEVFQKMLDVIAKSKGDEMLDQNIINLVYSGRKIAIDKHFDCIDPIGIVPGMKEKCSPSTTCRKNKVVVSHFTGMFKPTKAFPPYLRMVQRPDAVMSACENTNHGGCAKWANYYCELHRYRQHLTPELQYAMQQVGGCCLGKGHNSPGCKSEIHFNNATDGCPAAVMMESQLFAQGDAKLLRVSNRTPEDIHDFRPIFQYEGTDVSFYLYYFKAKGNWIAGPEYRTDAGFAYAHTNAICPNDATQWKTSSEHGWVALGQTHVSPTVTACPASFSVSKGEGWPEDVPSFWMGVYDKAEIAPEAMHGLRPVYQLRSEDSSNPVYLYYLMGKTSWVIGPSYTMYEGYARTNGDSYCPKEAVQWMIRMSPTIEKGATLMITEAKSSDTWESHNLRPIAVEDGDIAEEDEDIADEKTNETAEENEASEEVGVAEEDEDMADEKTNETAEENEASQEVGVAEEDEDITDEKTNEIAEENEASEEVGVENQVEMDTEIIREKRDEVVEDHGLADLKQRQRGIDEHIVSLEGQVKRALNRNKFEKLKPLGRKLVSLRHELELISMPLRIGTLKAWGASLLRRSHKGDKVVRALSTNNSDALSTQHDMIAL